MVNLLFVTQVFSFLSFGIGQSDLSIIYFLFVSFIYLFRWRLRRSDLSSYFSIFLVFSVFLITLDVAFLKLFASIVFIFLFYSISVHSNSPLRVNTVLSFSILWFSAAALTVIKADIFVPFMYRVGATADRGVAGLTAEPSLLGIYSSMFFAIISDVKAQIDAPRIIRRSNLSVTSFKLFASSSLMFLTTLLASSMLGFVLFGLILLHKGFYKLLLFSLVGAVLVLVVYVDQDSRIFVLGRYLLSANFVELFSDLSIVHRLNSFLVALNPSSYIKGDSLSAGLTPLIYTLGHFGQLLVFVLLILFTPFRVALSHSFRSFGLASVLLVLLFVGPIAVLPFWIMIALEGRRA